MNIVQNKINPHIYINQIKKIKLEFRSGNSLVSPSSSLSLSNTEKKQNKSKVGLWI